MSTLTVAVTDYGFPDIRQEKELLEPIGFQFVTGQCKTAEEVSLLCQDADAILTQWAPVTEEVMQRLNKCKIIVRYGIGVDNVDLDAAKRRNIPVVNVPDYAINEVADHALSLLLSSVRKIPQVVSQVRRGVWEIAPCRPIIGLQEKTVGLAGFGNIARAVAHRAQAFGMKVIAYDPFVDEEAFQASGVEKADWNTLLEQSDILSVHLPLNKETKHILGQEAFKSMKSSAYLINTSRGGVIHTEDLVEALEKQRIAGAALDVLEHEPVSSDSPLLRMDSCLITSHCAWYSENSILRLQLFAATEIKKLFSGETPKHIVNGVQL